MHFVMDGVVMDTKRSILDHDGEFDLSRLFVDDGLDFSDRCGRAYFQWAHACEKLPHEIKRLTALGVDVKNEASEECRARWQDKFDRAEKLGSSEEKRLADQAALNKGIKDEASKRGFEPDKIQVILG